MKIENPHNYTETPLHPQKIGVWCAISRRRIIGPLFFETSINAEELIQQFIALLQVDARNCWFQQDSANAHIAASTMVILQEFFGENVIRGNICVLDQVFFTDEAWFHFSG